MRSLGIDNSTKWECDPHLLVVVEAPCLVLREYLPEMDESPCYQWVNPLFLYISTGPSSIVMLNDQRVTRRLFVAFPYQRWHEDGLCL